MTKTFGSFFSGGGLADIGAKMAGYDLTFAVEYDAQIAEVYRRNLGNHITVADVRDVDIDALPLVDLFHASPVCTNASIANNKRGEQQFDIETAQATAEYIRRKLPPTVTIENVTQYKQFAAYRLIIATLDECGYWHNADTLNSADFGVPQTRRRLVVRAVRGGWVPALPAPVRWVGWYEAIEDLVDTFELCGFSKSMLDVIYGATWEKDFIVDTRNRRKEQDGSTYRYSNEPAATLVSSSKTRRFRAWISGRAFIPTTKAFARFQSIPEWYQLPDNTALACKIIGNGVPCLMYKAVAEAFLP
jgi:DNA (cytosine-5)-methyltransferase 1